MSAKAKYHHKSDPVDPRDYKLPDRPADAPPLSKRVDLRPIAPPVYDQLGFGSCTANATAALLDTVRKKDGLEFMNPSRMFLYYNARLLKGNADKDEGCCFRDMLDCIYDNGACEETLWGYTSDTLFTKPTLKCYEIGVNNKFQYYAFIEQNLNALKHCLDEGFPFILSIKAYFPIEQDHMLMETNILSSTPKEWRNGVLYQHAVCCVGYDDDQQLFLIRNSWGPDWAVGGHFCIKYDMMIDPDYCEAFWTLRTSSTWETTQYT